MYNVHSYDELPLVTEKDLITDKEDRIRTVYYCPYFRLCQRLLLAHDVNTNLKTIIYILRAFL